MEGKIKIATAPLAPDKLQRLEDFFGAIAPIEAAYRYNTFAFVAVRVADAMILLKGAVFMALRQTPLPLSHFKSAGVFAGCYRLDDLGFDLRGFIQQALTGSIRTPDGEVLFPHLVKGEHQISHERFHSLGHQERLDTLTLTGASLPSFGGKGLEWELRSNVTPYESIDELCNEYDLGRIDDNFSTLHVIPFSVVSIDGTSRVDGTKALIAVRAADGLDTNKVSLGYRVFNPGNRVVRGSIPGEKLRWEKSDDMQIGRVEIDVPAAALIDCIAGYDGHARQRWWTFDLSRAQNPRRAVYEEVDPDLEVLRDYLSRTGKSNRDAQDFEAGVAVLLWMLGFGPAHLGNHKNLHSADIIATTTQGNFAVVECTTGLLKAENKMARVVERAERVRGRVQGTPFRVLPVMVTSWPDWVKADLEAAEKLGVLVVAREELDEAVNFRSMRMPDSDAIFEEAEKTAREAQARHDIQPNLNLAGRA